MRMRAGFISNSSTSSFVIFFGPPAPKTTGRGKKAAATKTTVKASASASEPSPQQYLETAVEGAMESGWLDPLLGEMRRQLDDCGTWDDIMTDDDDDDEDEEEEEEEEGDEEEEADEPQAKKRRKTDEAKEKGKKQQQKKKRNTQEEKRWAAMRKAMTEYLTAPEPTPIAEFIKSEQARVRSMRKHQEQRKKERKAERDEEGEGEGGFGMGDMPWLWGLISGGFDNFSDQEGAMDIRAIEEQIAFAKKQQTKRGFCVEFSCSNQDGEVCSEAMHRGMMDLVGMSGEHMAVIGINNE